MYISPRPAWTSSSHRAMECAVTRIRSQGTYSLSALSTETSRCRRGRSINLYLRVEGSGNGPFRNGDVEIGGAFLEQGDHLGRHSELQRHVERVAESHLEPRPQAHREGVGGGGDRRDPSREVRAGKGRHGPDRRAEVAVRRRADIELHRPGDPDPG